MKGFFGRAKYRENCTKRARAGTAGGLILNDPGCPYGARAIKLTRLAKPASHFKGASTRNSDKSTLQRKRRRANLRATSRALQLRPAPAGAVAGFARLNHWMT